MEKVRLSWRNQGSRIAAMAIAIASACGMIAAIAPAPAGAAAGNGLLNPWAEEQENANPKQQPIPLAQAKRDAQNFNIIIAHPVA